MGRAHEDVVSLECAAVLFRVSPKSSKHHRTSPGIPSELLGESQGVGFEAFRVETRSHSQAAEYTRRECERTKVLLVVVEDLL